MSSTLRSRLSLRDKVEIITMYDNNGCSEQEVRRKYHIDRVHFYKIISRKEEYLSQYARAPIKNSVNMEVNNRVWDWYAECKANNIAINGPMIQNQARKIAKQLGYDGFRASNGWLQCFKMRHNIRFTGPPAHKRDPQQIFSTSPMAMMDVVDQTPHWPKTEAVSPPAVQKPDKKLGTPDECETIEIIESDGDDEGSEDGADIDEDEGNDIQDEISFEDEMISERKFNPPLRQAIQSQNGQDDVCRNYQDVLDCIHRLECFSVSTGDNKLLEMSVEMRNHVERTIYGVDN